MATFPSIRPSSRSHALTLVTAVIGAALAASLFYTPIPFAIFIAIPFFIYFGTRPYELLLVMVFLIPFNFIVPIGPVPVAAELLKVFVWVPFLVSRWGKQASFCTSKYNKYFTVIAALLFLSLFRSHDFPYTIKECVRLASNIGLCYVLLNLVDTREKVMDILRVLTASCFLVAAYGLYQFAIQDYGPLFWIVNPRLDTGLSHYRDTFWPWRNRIVSVLTSEMELGHYFNLCLPIGVLLWTVEGRKRVGSKWFWTVLAMLAGLVLTFTFSAWLALLATSGLYFLFFAKKGSRSKALIAGVILLAIIVAVLTGPLQPFVEGKLLSTGVGSVAWDLATRAGMWMFALQTWWSHPLIGVGVGNYEVLSSSTDWVLGAQSLGTTPHQTYFYLLAI